MQKENKKPRSLLSLLGMVFIGVAFATSFLFVAEAMETKVNGTAACRQLAVEEGASYQGWVINQPLQALDQRKDVVTYVSCELLGPNGYYAKTIELRR